MTRHRFLFIAALVAAINLFAASTPEASKGRLDLSLLETASAARVSDTPVMPGINIADLDPSVRPQDDFWGYVNGKWIAKTEIPPDQVRWGSFLILHENSQRDVREIIEELSGRSDLTAGSPPRKIRDLYNSFMDAAEAERLGLEPIKDELARVDRLHSIQDLADYFGHAARVGISTPIGYWVDQDSKHATAYIVYFTQAGLGLPDRDYYFDQGPKAEGLRAEYRKFAGRLFHLAGIQGGPEGVQKIFDLEQSLAAHHWTRVQNRDREKTYNKMTPGDFRKLSPGFDWIRYWRGTGLADQPSFIVRQPSYFHGLSQVLAAHDLETWRNYLKLRVLSGAAPYLNDAFFRARFDFYGKTLQGQEQPKERWKRGVDLVNRVLGELVGQEYVRRHFPPSAKRRMLELVNNLRLATAESIEAADWMNDATKAEARKKLAKFTTKIGYPDKWRDYSALEIRPGDLIGNIRRASEFEYQREINKLGKPIDRSEWFMTPQTVNAYYNPEMNEIVFPAAILQPPFFAPRVDDAVNYGGIGAVIGHEIGHGFDDQGRKSDGDGNLRDWWTPEDIAEYQKRAQKVVEQYNAFSPIEGEHINGKLTLGENIGDLNGLTLGWRAYRKSLEGKPIPEPIDGLTGDQRFFISFAQIWRNRARPEYLRQQIKTNPHSPGRFRLMGSLQNFTPFYQVFGLKPGDAMYRSPEERVSMW